MLCRNMNRRCAWYIGGVPVVYICFTCGLPMLYICSTSGFTPEVEHHYVLHTVCSWFAY